MKQMLDLLLITFISSEWSVLKQSWLLLLVVIPYVSACTCNSFLRFRLVMHIPSAFDL